MRAASECPQDAPGPAAPKTSARRPPSQKCPAENGPNEGCAMPWGGGGAKLVRRIRNGAKVCERTPCSRGMPRAQPRPKTSSPTTPSQNRPAEMGQNGGCAIAFVEGWGEVGPPDSEWGQTLRAASVCPWNAKKSARGMPRVQPRPKRSARRPPSQNRPAEKGQNGGWAIALVGGVAQSWSAGLGMWPNFASGVRVPAGCPGNSSGKK